MPMIDTGFFILLSLIAFSFMLLSFKYTGSSAQGVFNILSFIILMTLALYLVSDYSVGSVTETVIPLTNTTGHLVGNFTQPTTEYLVEGFDEQTAIGLIYFVVGLFNAGLAFFALLPRPQKDEGDF